MKSQQLLAAWRRFENASGEWSVVSSGVVMVASDVLPLSTRLLTTHSLGISGFRRAWELADRCGRWRAFARSCFPVQETWDSLEPSGRLRRAALRSCPQGDSPFVRGRAGGAGAASDTFSRGHFESGQFEYAPHLALCQLFRGWQSTPRSLSPYGIKESVLAASDFATLPHSRK